MKGVLVPVGATPRERGAYRSLQCTSCHALGGGYGLRYRLFAGPDVVLFHALADALAGGSAPVVRKACVLAPGISRLPTRVSTDRTDVAVAFAVWMGVEKLRDDVADEGGLLRYLAARAFAKGHARARYDLLAASFPVAAIEVELARQREVEASESDLERAVAPTRAIAGHAFGALAPGEGGALAAAIGRRVGALLFWLDNALDLPADLAAGRYNALARAHAVTADASWDTLSTLRDEALAAARAEHAALRVHLDALPASDAADLVRNTLGRGLAAQIDALARLEPARWRAARSADLQPQRARWSRVFAAAVEPFTARARTRWAHLWWRATYRPRLALSLAAMALFPRAAWPTEWWPEDEPALVDTALEWPDTGGFPEEPPPESEAYECNDWLCNPCLASCGYADCDPAGGCGNACDAACSPTCDNACDNVCDVNCNCS